MKLHQDGFSLIQIMVAAALMGVMAYLGMMQFENLTKQNKSVEITSGINAVSTDIQAILADNASCDQTMAGKTVGSPISEIFYRNKQLGTNIVKYRSGNGPQGSEDFYIEKFELIQDSSSSIFLKVDFISKKEIYGSQKKSRSIPIKVASFNADGTIKSCYSDQENTISTAIAEACKSLGVNWNDTEKRCDVGDLLPKCVVVPDGGCFGLYAKVEEYQVPHFTGQRTCFQQYDLNASPCSGTPTLTKTSSCSGTGCTCHFTNVSCYTKSFQTQVDVLTYVKMNRCCRP